MPHRLVRDLLEIGAAAGNRTRTISLARRHSAVKPQPRELKGPGVFMLPARAISTKNKHLLVIYSIPTRGFTAAVSVFKGTPPPKPLEYKFWLNTMGALLCERWAEPTGGEPRLSRALFSFVSLDIIKMSPSLRCH